MKDTSENGNEKSKKLPRTIEGFIVFIFLEIREQKKWFLLPFWFCLVFLGLAIIISGGSYILPAIYIAF